jgi:hypothetical protein
MGHLRSSVGFASRSSISPTRSVGVVGVFAFAWVVGAVYVGSINKGAITRETTPWSFWLIVAGVATAGLGTLVYNVYLFRRGVRKAV